MARGKSILGHVMSKIIGLIVLVALVAVLNLLVSFFDIPVLGGVVSFINSNLILLIIIGVLFLVSGIIEELAFPFNLPAPLLNGAGGVLVVIFIFNIIGIFSSVIGGFMPVINVLEMILYFVVFGIVVLVGYLDIFSSEPSGRRGRSEKRAWHRRKKKR